MSSPCSRRRRQASAPSPPGSMRSSTSRSGAYRVMRAARSLASGREQGVVAVPVEVVGQQLAQGQSHRRRPAPWCGNCPWTEWSRLSGRRGREMDWKICLGFLSRPPVVDSAKRHCFGNSNSMSIGAAEQGHAGQAGGGRPEGAEGRLVARRAAARRAHVLPGGAGKLKNGKQIKLRFIPPKPLQDLPRKIPHLMPFQLIHV